MPVRKYRSVQNMEDTFWIQPGTPEHHKAILRVIESAAFFAKGKSLPHGVFKFSSIEESAAQVETWNQEATNLGNAARISNPPKHRQG
jgi:hypothetical protein